MEGQENLYDEFGNYIGPDISSEESSSESSEEITALPFAEEQPAPNAVSEIPSAAKPAALTAAPSLRQSVSGAIVLHEDKQYYPDASEVYPGAEVVTQLEDTQPIEQPIIAPVSDRLHCEVESRLPNATFSYKFMANLMEKPRLMRNLCFLGQLHHGKTLFMDQLVKECHPNIYPEHVEKRYTDIGKDEQARGLSIKAIPMSLVLQTQNSKSFLLNVMDCPGHSNFSDESSPAVRISDGAVLFIDSVEGVMKQTIRYLSLAVKEGLAIVLNISKLDRLILELKLPPKDAYHKLVGILKEVNDHLKALGSSTVLSPENGNVCFSSAKFGWSFTLESFARVVYGENDLDCFKMAERLWGNYCFEPEEGRFLEKKTASDAKRSFVEFVLEPLYKIYSVILSSEPKELTGFLDNLKLKLKKSDLRKEPHHLIRHICKEFFNGCSGFVDMLVKHFPDPETAAKDKIKRIYTGNLSTPCAKSMSACQTYLEESPETAHKLIRAPAMVNIVKFYPRADCSAFDVFGRVFSGMVRRGDKVRVLRDGYSLDDDEDMCVKTVEEIWIFQGRFRVAVNQVGAGNWALFGGLDSAITKSATLTQVEGNDSACIFRPLNFDTLSVVKLAIEPLKPSELPKMLEALRNINNTYPLSQTKVEESGEHILLGTGELYLDCIMHDIREKYSDIEVKVADPVVRFAETVLETSSIPCFSSTPNKQNKITMICEPLDAKIASDIECGRVDPKWAPGELTEHFEQSYKWDVLASRSIWAFGPEDNGPNVLLDDTLPSQGAKDALQSVKNSVIQGFQWGTREGPLCDEPIRNCRFKIVGAEISDNALHRGGGQVIPTARRVAYSAFLLATPRLMEPVYLVEILAPVECVPPIYHLLGLRRGFVVSEAPKPGTPLFVVRAHVPVIDSFGLETDLRTHTQGQAFCTSVFDHWEMVPGDPLDKDVVLKPLEPAPPDGLAREFMVKTRRRKGLEEDVTAYKFFDEAMMFALAEHEAEQEE